VAAVRRRPLRQTLARWAIFVIVGGYLLLPLFAMGEFSTRDDFGTRSLDSWFAIADNPNLVGSIIVTISIAALTVIGMLLLLVPTMAWTYIRVPALKRPVEFLCLLPLAIPAVVLVVGIVPIYSILSQLTRGSPLTLALIDVILVLPYAHRALDAGMKSIDVATLAEAARSLGASWPRAMFQIIAPNLRGAILSAAVISVALVLGEFTISSLLNYDTLQVVISMVGQRDAFVAVAVSLAALLFAFVLVLLIAVLGAERRRTAEEPLEEVLAI
jgi:putative spermidine/putrescine transport system permease protein